MDAAHRLPSISSRMCFAPLLPEFLAAHCDLVVETAFEERYVDLTAEHSDIAVRAFRRHLAQRRGCAMGQPTDGPLARPISHDTPPRTVAAIWCPSRCSITGFHGTRLNPMPSSSIA